MISSSKGDREVLLIGRALMQARLTVNEEFEAEFCKKINAWAEQNVPAPGLEERGSERLQRERVHKGRRKERGVL